MKSGSSGIDFIKDSNSNINESSALRLQLAEYQIELSALPVLKSQLKEKVKELEVMKMYAKEVEVCNKLKAPIPNLSLYKKSILGMLGNRNDISYKEQLSACKNKPGLIINKGARNLNQGTKKYFLGTVKPKNITDKKSPIRSRMTPGQYRANVSVGQQNKSFNST